MCAYKADENVTNGEFYNHHQSVVISFDIENISLVAYTVNAIKSVFYVCKTCPFCMLCFIIPILQSSFCFRV